MAPQLRPPVRALIARVWEGRYLIEMEASSRFASLAARLQSAGAPEAVWTLSQRASEEELRHAAHCVTYLTQYGGAKPRAPSGVVEYAPRSLPAEQRLVYEVVGQCCIAETQSTTTLVTLLEEVEDPALLLVLQELARDEVNHGRMGWAFLAWAKERMDLSFLAGMLPSMIAGSAGEGLFAHPSEDEDLPELLKHGVVPARMRQQLYVDTLKDVVFLGFQEMGVTTAPAEAWLQSGLEKSRAHAKS